MGPLLRVILWVPFDQVVTANQRTQGNKGRKGISLINYLIENPATLLHSTNLLYEMAGGEEKFLQKYLLTLYELLNRRPFLAKCICPYLWTTLIDVVSQISEQNQFFFNEKLWSWRWLMSRSREQLTGKFYIIWYTSFKAFLVLVVSSERNLRMFQTSYFDLIKCYCPQR